VRGKVQSIKINDVPFSPVNTPSAYNDWALTLCKWIGRQEETTVIFTRKCPKVVDRFRKQAGPLNLILHGSYPVIKKPNYSISDRHEMLRFIPVEPNKSLEIGCREALFSKRLKEKFKKTETWAGANLS